jgi:hypothetical protein
MERRGEGKSENISAFSAGEYTTTFLVRVSLGQGTPLLMRPNSKILRQGN